MFSYNLLASNGINVYAAEEIASLVNTFQFSNRDNPAVMASVCSSTYQVLIKEQNFSTLTNKTY